MKQREEKNLEEVICNGKGPKYETAVLVMTWARHLKKQEECQNYSMSEILDRAIREVVNGSVKREEIVKIISGEKNLEKLTRASAGKHEKSDGK